MKHHRLKIEPQYFEDVEAGRKTFEIRREDRGFEIGDTLQLCEFEPMPGLGYTGREVGRTITYISYYMQMAGYVVLGMKA